VPTPSPVFVLRVLVARERHADPAGHGCRVLRVFPTLLGSWSSISSSCSLRPAVGGADRRRGDGHGSVGDGQGYRRRHHQRGRPRFDRHLSGFTGWGALLIETIFSLNALGLLGYEAVISRDYPVMFGTLFCFTLLGLILNIVGDITYVFVDPRIDFENRNV
jgi:hypothetical protein